MAEQLQKQIKEGKLKEGDKLPTEPELMKVFGVGRSTIREAVKMLLNKGYISVQQGRGTFVESQTPVMNHLSNVLNGLTFKTYTMCERF